MYARQEQAIIQSRLEHEDQAIAIYDIILSAKPAADAELRYAALAGKADNLLALGRRELPKRDRLNEALAVLDELAGQSGVPAQWRNQALYKKAKALEQLGQNDQALAAYYDVLEKSAPEGREFFWYYKAGFDAAAIFEKQSDWKAAIGIYQKMAAMAGPRASEAKARLTQLRLERFIWD